MILNFGILILAQVNFNKLVERLIHASLISEDGRPCIVAKWSLRMIMDPLNLQVANLLPEVAELLPLLDGWPFVHQLHVVAWNILPYVSVNKLFKGNLIGIIRVVIGDGRKHSPVVITVILISTISFFSHLLIVCTNNFVH
jgi:hypothetical protein